MVNGTENEPDGSIEGEYVNSFRVGYDSDVFVLDSFQLFSGDKSSITEEQSVGNPTYRIITTPADAKQLLKHLEYTIEAYEIAHGAITESMSSP